MVNAIGVESVMANLPTAYSAAYGTAKIHKFTDSEGEHVGWFKEALDHKGRVSFVSFHNAGHMVRVFLLGRGKADLLGTP